MDRTLLSQSLNETDLKLMRQIHFLKTGERNERLGHIPFRGQKPNPRPPDRYSSHPWSTEISSTVAIRSIRQLTDFSRGPSVLPTALRTYLIKECERNRNCADSHIKLEKLKKLANK
jgi:hypothetical protein